MATYGKPKKSLEHFGDLVFPQYNSSLWKITKKFDTEEDPGVTGINGRRPRALRRCMGGFFRFFAFCRADCSFSSTRPPSPYKQLRISIPLAECAILSSNSSCYIRDHSYFEFRFSDSSRFEPRIRWTPSLTVSIIYSGLRGCVCTCARSSGQGVWQKCPNYVKAINGHFHPRSAHDRKS